MENGLWLDLNISQKGQYTCDFSFLENVLSFTVKNIACGLRVAGCRPFKKIEEKKTQQQNKTSSAV